MNPDLKIHFQTFVLKVLATAAVVGITEDHLLLQVRMQITSEATLPQLQAELRTMADKGWAIEVPSHFGGSKRWRVASLGESVAEELRL